MKKSLFAPVKSHQDLHSPIITEQSSDYQTIQDPFALLASKVEPSIKRANLYEREKHKKLLQRSRQPMINQQGTDKDLLNDDISECIERPEPRSPSTLLKQRRSEQSHEKEIDPTLQQQIIQHKTNKPVLSLRQVKKLKAVITSSRSR